MGEAARELRGDSLEARRPRFIEWKLCPVCRGETVEPFVEFLELAFVRCPTCGAVYKQFELEGLRVKDFYERDYFHGRKSGRDKRFEHRVRKAAEWIRTALEHHPARSLLDIGCSFGYVIEAAQRLGLTAAGMDISQYAVDVCRQRGYRAEVGSLERLPFPDREFDLIVMKHVLEHTATPRLALAEVRRVLKPGGAVLIAVPNLEYWKGLERRRTYRYFRPDDLGQQHYVYYTTDSLVRLLESGGFQTVTRRKDEFRPLAWRSSRARRITEPVRFAALRAAMAFARQFGLQREVFVVARKSEQPPGE